MNETVIAITRTRHSDPRAVPLLSPVGLPSRIDQVLYGVIMEAYVRGVSTCAVHDLVKAPARQRDLQERGLPDLRRVRRAPVHLPEPGAGSRVDWESRQSRSHARESA